MKERGLRSSWIRVVEDSGFYNQVPLSKRRRPLWNESTSGSTSTVAGRWWCESVAGERLSVVRVDNDPVALAAAVTEAGPSPGGGDRGRLPLVLGGGPAAGAERHGASGQPQGVELGDRRVKNDVVDATDLADMLRLGRPPRRVDRPAGDP